MYSKSKFWRAFGRIETIVILLSLIAASVLVAISIKEIFKIFLYVSAGLVAFKILRVVIRMKKKKNGEEKISDTLEKIFSKNIVFPTIAVCDEIMEKNPSFTSENTKIISNTLKELEQIRCAKNFMTKDNYGIYELTYDVGDKNEILIIKENDDIDKIISNMIRKQFRYLAVRDTPLNYQDILVITERYKNAILQK